MIIAEESATYLQAKSLLMLMSVEEIKEYLPQRYPFLLVDRITEMDLGKSIVGYKNVTNNEPFFIGHFPGQPA